VQDRVAAAPGVAHGHAWRRGDPAPPPLEAPPESSVTADWRDGPPVVSVLCMAYQHAGLIEDALGGILAQRTTFPFEVIVRDDASTDGTAEVVADVAGQYPSIVRAILETRNRRPDRPRIGAYATGRYVARCDGDDYWTDPHKLATQVATLEASAAAVLSHHQAIVVADGEVLEPERLPADHQRDYTPSELVRAKLALTSTMLYRNLDLPDHPHFSQIANKDMLLLAQLGEHGGARWEPSVLPSVYRHHPGASWTTRAPAQQAIDSARSYYWIGHYFAERDTDVAQHFLGRGLAWYARGCREAGVSVTSVLAQAGDLITAAVRDATRRPASLQALVDERDAARAERDQAVEGLRRIRARRSVRMIDRIARLGRVLQWGRGR
jgi:glycosyltransferase involved in cell wall biosynthesis